MHAPPSVPAERPDTERNARFGGWAGGRRSVDYSNLFSAPVDNLTPSKSMVSAIASLVLVYSFSCDSMQVAVCTRAHGQHVSFHAGVPGPKDGVHTHQYIKHREHIEVRPSLSKVQSDGQLTLHFSSYNNQIAQQQTLQYRIVSREAFW